MCLNQRPQVVTVCSVGATLVTLELFRRRAWVREWVRVHWEVVRLGMKHEGEAQKTAKLGWTRRWERMKELAFVLSIERTRRLEVLEAKRRYPNDANAAYRLYPLRHVSTQRQLARRQKQEARMGEAEQIRRMMERHNLAAQVPIIKEIVLIGGGHSHVHALRMFGMEPTPGVRVTLITKDVETPYSGMLPGHVAGYYSRAECHIDLNQLARFAKVRLIKAEVAFLDVQTKSVHLADTDRPAIPYDVVSLNVGITPEFPLDLQQADNVTPVKPIAKFSKAWDSLLDDKVTSWRPGRQYDVVVVGGGAGGVELALAMRARVRTKLKELNRDPDMARFSLVTRGSRILPSHAEGVRTLMENALSERGVTVVPNCEALGIQDLHLEKKDHLNLKTTSTTRKALRCRFNADGAVGGNKKKQERPLPFDECVWCTQAAAPKLIRDSNLAVDDRGFARVDEFQRCGLASDPQGTRDSLNVFAVGDCSTVDGHPRPKAGVFAVMAGMALYQNVLAAVTNTEFVKHVPQKSFLGLLGTGDGSCVASRGELAFQADWLWDLKDWIDRKWMWQYTGGLPDLTLADGRPPPAFGGPWRDDMGAEEKNHHPTAALMAFTSSPDTLEVLKRSPMRCGGCGAKVGATTLARALKALPKTPEPSDTQVQVLVGVEAPDDGAVVRYSQDKPLVQSVDFFRAFLDDPYIFGRIAANHALSDCEAMGSKPATALAIAVVPFGSDFTVENDLAAVMTGVRKTLDDAGCVLIGGHTCEGAELAVGLSITGTVPSSILRPVDNALKKNLLLSKGGLRANDAVILTKPLGTGCVMAADMRAKAPWPSVSAALDSMLASNRAAADVLRSHEVAACTDVTGFGLLGHLAEMCRASNGAHVSLDLDNVPLLPGALDLAQQGLFSSLQPDNLRAKRAVTNHDDLIKSSPAVYAKYALLFDPQTAGGLLAAVHPRDAQAVIHRLNSAGYPHAAVIGTVQAADDPTHFPAAVTVHF